MKLLQTPKIKYNTKDVVNRKYKKTIDYYSSSAEFVILDEYADYPPPKTMIIVAMAATKLTFHEQDIIEQEHQLKFIGPVLFKNNVSKKRYRKKRRKVAFPSPM